MNPDAPQAEEKQNVDPNEWDERESVFEFIHRQYPQLSAKIPTDLDVKDFRISFVATTNKPEYPIVVYFTAAAEAPDLGVIKCRGRNPFLATKALIERLYKAYAKEYQREEFERRRHEEWRQAAREEEAAKKSLMDYSPEGIADIVDGRAPLPPDIPEEMIWERARKIGIETVRQLSDEELKLGVAPEFLCEEERKSFCKRCASEVEIRSRLREMLDKHRNEWPVAPDDYGTFLQVWRLCQRQNGTLEALLNDFFASAQSESPRRLQDILPEAPELINAIRRRKLAVTRERDEKRRKEQEVERANWKPDEEIADLMRQPTTEPI